MDPVDWIRNEIEHVIRHWVNEGRSENFWRFPVRTGVADVQDPLFRNLPHMVAPDHAQPHSLLGNARSVIVFFLPFRKEVVFHNRNESTPYAAKVWAEAYVATNSLIARICTHLQHALAVEGYASAVTPATHNFDEKRLVSRWSHKHLAYIAGLGTFGLHRQIITESGCAGRLGSLVTSKSLPATPRKAKEHCLAKAGRSCGVCISRCTYGALKKERFDRQRCYAQLLENDRYYSDLPLVDVCGKCVADVPCSFEIPADEKRTEAR